MAVSPDSKTVKGLNIAILVLAILGIVSLLGFAAVGSAGISYVTNDAQYSTGSAAGSSMVSDIKNVAESLRSLDGDAIKSVIDDVSKLSKSDFATLSKAMDTGSDTRILEALKSVEVGEGLSSAQMKALAYLLSLTSATDSADLANQLSSMSYTEIQQLANDLEGVTTNSSTSYSSTGTPYVAEGIALIKAYGPAVLAIIVIYFLIGYIISLVASILGMRNCNKPEKLAPAFVFAIVGAVLALMTGRIVTMVLHIIAAVKTHAVQKFVPNVGQPEVVQAPTYAPEPPVAALATPAVDADPAEVASAEETEPAVEVEPAVEPEPALEAAPNVEAASAAKADPAAAAAEAAQATGVGQTAEAEQAVEAEPAVEPEPAVEAAPAEVNAASEPEVESVAEPEVAAESEHAPEPPIS